MRHFADLLLNKNNSKANDQVPFIQRRRGIEIKSSREINLMKKSSRIVATVLREINDLIKPGMSTKDLDDFAEKRIKSFGAVPSFKGYHGFPSSICSSINNEVVHGIPNKNKIINNGDLVKIEGSKFCKTLNDRWTVITKDGKLSAQWEHTIVVLKDGIEILTDRDF